MAGFRLKVTPDVLKTQSQTIQNEIRNIEKQWSNIETLIKRSKGYWEGDASQQHIKYYEEVKDSVLEAIKRLKEHPNDLLKMAGIYDSAEKKSAGLTNYLPDEVIV